MRPLNRRGFTLIEIMIAVVLTGLMAGLAFQAMTGSQRMTRSLGARVDAQGTARSAMLYLGTAFRELSATDGDIITAGATAMKYRAMRWTGISCTGVTVAGGNLQVTVRKSQLWGNRAPAPGLDSTLVYAENNIGTRQDDVWLVGGLSDTATIACPNAAPGMRLTFAISAASGGNAAAQAGFTLYSPLRGFQHEEVSLYANAGTNWFGHKTMDAGGTWTAVEPLVGPLTATGLAFTYYDTLNVVTATLTDIASVGVIVRSQSTDAANTSTGIGNLRDSLITRIALRNNRRF